MGTKYPWVLECILETEQVSAYPYLRSLSTRRRILVPAVWKCADSMPDTALAGPAGRRPASAAPGLLCAPMRTWRRAARGHAAVRRVSTADDVMTMINMMRDDQLV